MKCCYLLLFTWSLLFRLDAIITHKCLTFSPLSVHIYPRHRVHDTARFPHIKLHTSLYLAVMTIPHSDCNNSPKSLCRTLWSFLSFMFLYNFPSSTKVRSSILCSQVSHLYMPEIILDPKQYLEGHHFQH